MAEASNSHAVVQDLLPDDITQTDLDQWLDDGGRDVPDPDFDAAHGTDSSAG